MSLLLALFGHGGVSHLSPLSGCGKHMLARSFSGFDPTVWTGRALQAECVKKGGGWSCASVSGPCMERLCSWPSWISARTRSHSEKGPERPLGSPDHGCDGETVSPFPPSNSQTSAGISCVRDQRRTSPRRGPNPLSSPPFAATPPSEPRP